MFNKIWYWLCGYYIVRVTGVFRHRFVNVCNKNNIKMWNLSEEKESILFYIKKKDLKSATEFCNKIGVDMTIEKRKGLHFFIRKYRKRYGFIMGILCFFTMVYGFTNFIWDIDVVGESVYTEDEIIKLVRDNYVDILTPKKNVDCDSLEMELRDIYDKVAWISCDITGTKLNIRITETIDKNEVIKYMEPSNIVAIKDGILTDVIVRNGKANRIKGDEVKKGDIIITGAINIYNDYDELLETSYIAADGDVYAYVITNYVDEFSMEYYDKVYTGDEKKSYELVVNEEFFPIKFGKEYVLCDEISTEHKLVLGESVYLPIYFNVIEYREYVVERKSYSKDEAISKAEKRLGTYIEDLQKKGVEIVENNVTIIINEGKCKSEGTIVTKELIGVPAPLTIIEQGEEL